MSFNTFARVGVAVLAGAALAACTVDERPDAAHQEAPLQALSGPEMYFVAHPDDDLLFINPEIENAILRGRSVRVVYLTSGDAGQGTAYWQSREDGMLTAYAAMAGTAKTWTCATSSYAGKNVRQCTLTPRPQVSVVFMRLRDGLLPQLWATGNNAPFFVNPQKTETTVDAATSYTRVQAISTLRAMISSFAPTKIGTLDSTLAYGPDEHSDHVASALFVLEAAHGYGGTYEVGMYRGYTTFQTWNPDVLPEARNLSQADRDEKARIMLAYGSPVDPGSLYDEWAWRRYVISRIGGGRSALVHAGGKCLDVSGGAVTTGAKAVASTCSGKASQSWTLQPGGQITTTGGLCLSVATNGTTVQVASCQTGSTSQSWWLMSNGQLRGLNGACLTLSSDGTSLTAGLCDGDLSTHLGSPLASQRWAQPFGSPSTWSVGSDFADADLPAANVSSLQIGDVNADGRADACARKSDGLYCALATGNAAFSGLLRVSQAFADASGWAGDAYGNTLQLGDLNGDQRADVCGRRAGGIACAVWSGGSLGAVTSWSTDYSDAAGFASNVSYFRSVRLADINGDGRSDICGRRAAGVDCSLNTGTAFGPATSWSSAFSDAAGWSATGAVLMFGDVNGDGRADVCGRNANGVSCALAPASGTGFGPLRPWSMRTDFSDATGWGSSAASYGSLGLADVTGDGYADVCGRSPSGLVCAISNGLAFDSALPLGGASYSDVQGWSAAARGSSLRFGDLNQDGRPDVCGRAATGLVCALASSALTAIGPPPADAGSPAALDAGSPADAGSANPVDSGATSPLDSGSTSPLDAGSPGPADAGSPPPVDSGSPSPLDSGSPPPLDAGSPRPTDAGSPPPVDSATPPPTDAGAPPASEGGSPPAGTGGHLYVVAHPDDDLLFMNPDIEVAILAKRSVRTVYVTSGDAGNPASYWHEREDGIRAAHAAMANVANTWACASRTYAGKTATLCTLTPQPLVSLLFLRLPDGGLPALWATDSGPPFWVTPVSSASTVDGAATYTRAQLISALTAIMTEVSPQRVGTLDGTLAYGDDHTDHMSAAMFVLEAAHAYGSVQELRMYRGYSMFQNWMAVPAPLARNLTAAQHSEKTRLMTAYGSTPVAGDLYDEWCWRQYVTTSVIGGPAPVSARTTRCVDVSGGSATSGAAALAAACNGAGSQRWTLQANGDFVGTGGLCLAPVADGSSLSLASCAGSAQQKWTMFDNGQVRGANAGCLTLGDDNVTLSLATCGSQQVGNQLTVSAAQRWAH